MAVTCECFLGTRHWASCAHLFLTTIFYERHYFHCFTNEEPGAYERLNNLPKDTRHLQTKKGSKVQHHRFLDCRIENSLKKVLLIPLQLMQITLCDLSLAYLFITYYISLIQNAINCKTHKYFMYQEKRHQLK